MAYSDKVYFLKNMKQSELDNLIRDDAGVPQDSYLEEAIKDSDSFIDGYLKTKVTLPINPVPESIRRASYQVALFYLHDRIQYQEVPQRVKDNYDAAVNMLKDIAKGDVDIGTTAAEDTEAEAESNIDYDVDTNIFDRNSI